MAKIVKSIKVIDIINALNFLMLFLTCFVSNKLIIVSVLLFLTANIDLLFQVHKKDNISFFRHVWSFVVTFMGNIGAVSILSDTRMMAVICVIISLIYVYIIARKKKKSLIVILFYALCLSVVSYSMIIGLNCSFDKSESINISATVTGKTANGDWSGKHISSIIEVYSPEKIYDTEFGFQSIFNAGKLYELYDIDDEIVIHARNGAFGIRYFSTNSIAKP